MVSFDRIRMVSMLRFIQLSKILYRTSKIRTEKGKKKPPELIGGYFIILCNFLNYCRIRDNVSDEISRKDAMYLSLTRDIKLGRCVIKKSKRSCAVLSLKLSLNISVLITKDSIISRPRLQIS